MAPVKKDADEKKEAKLTPEQSAALVLDYLRKQNRPYSATDISTNLKNRVTKAAAAKLLKDMHERKEIEGRAAGKQIVYHTIQEEADESGLEVLQQMDAEITRLREETLALKAEEKELRASLREGASQVPLSELKASCAALEQDKAEMTARLSKLSGGDVKPISADERNKISLDHRKWQRAASARKKIRAELWSMIADQVDKSKWQETKDEIGLEF
ncbi:hypothetical protein LTR97_012282 [Elasticomyces elasticus]|uniref:Homologous-pairing protein 2 winged helix domain-containing protein n=1 Tax=Elasticomyces elasticus TaxID=574655 RepID=A0AAN7W0G4_9PEZI|nr:hypothetical protein LTR97_012282 [Elasticomyces elasticus]KAK5716487.1 hypothetical protein LTR15_009378 [Elasticomyces elasticus]